MPDSKEETQRTLNILKLSNELMYRRYLLNKDQMRNFFKELSIPDYIAMHIIQETEEHTEIYEGRTYLKDLAAKMQLTIRQTSNLVGNLRDRGLLVWSHDGNGSEGTYVMITESGRNLLRSQEQILRQYYGEVIEKYGQENLIQLLRLMKELETVMSSELERMEDACEYKDVE